MLDYCSISLHDDPAVRESFDIANDLLAQGRRDEAIVILTGLCSRGCVESMVNLGVLYIDGTDDERSSALGLFKRAAEMGNDSGMRNVGYSYALGLGCERNKEFAAEWYRKAGEHGNAKAQCNLGVLYEYGHGVPKSDSDAVEWYLMSAKNGYFRGQTNLGYMYLEGRGVEQDSVEAERWLTASGTPRARYHLAKMYLYGIGIDKDEAKGMDYLVSASSAGHKRSMALLASLTGTADLDNKKSDVDDSL